MIKKILASVLTLGLVGALTGCGSKNVQNVPVKQITLEASKDNAFSAKNNVYSGIAHYEKSSFFGISKDSYKVKIDFTGDVAIISLPEYRCKTKLLLVSQNSNVSIYAEEYVHGPCRIDPSASTQIRVNENEIDYLWQLGNEKLSATLAKN